MATKHKHTILSKKIFTKRIGRTASGRRTKYYRPYTKRKSSGKPHKTSNYILFRSLLSNYFYESNINYRVNGNFNEVSSTIWAFLTNENKKDFESFKINEVYNNIYSKGFGRNDTIDNHMTHDGWFNIENDILADKGAGKFIAGDKFIFDLSVIDCENYEMLCVNDFQMIYSILIKHLKDCLGNYYTKTIKFLKTSPPHCFPLVEIKPFGQGVNAYKYKLTPCAIETQEPEKNKKEEPKKPEKSEALALKEKELEIIKEKGKISMQRANKALELLKAGFNKDEIMKILGFQ